MKEGLMKNDERWMKNDEGWRMMMISSCWGVLITDRITDIGECRVSFTTEKSKKIDIVQKGRVGSTPKPYF